MRYLKKNGEEVIIYTEEERQKALEVSLTSLAASLGYTPIRQGVHYSLKEMDSLVIYNDRTWNRWSQKGSITGGSQIDFMLAFGGASSVPEAIQQLLEFKGESITKVGYEIPVKEEKIKREFSLPPKNDNYRRLFAYLTKTRGISSDVVSDFVHRGLIYEDAAHHNIVYCGYDPDGIVRYAGLRGTADIYGRKFKMDVAGNDKNYGVNIVNPSSDELKVFESVIDCMSYIDMYDDRTSNKLVLGMVEDNPLEQFLKDYDHIQNISFCLDFDEAGQKAIYGEKKEENGKRDHIGLVEKYESQGYHCHVEIPPIGKDYNEALIDMKGYQRENPEYEKLKNSAYLLSGRAYATIGVTDLGYDMHTYGLSMEELDHKLIAFQDIPFPEEFTVEDALTVFLGLEEYYYYEGVKEAKASMKLLDYDEIRIRIQEVEEKDRDRQEPKPGDRYICMAEDKFIDEFSILATIKHVTKQTITFERAMKFGELQMETKTLTKEKFGEYYEKIDDNIERDIITLLKSAHEYEDQENNIKHKAR